MYTEPGGNLLGGRPYYFVFCEVLTRYVRGIIIYPREWAKQARPDENKTRNTILDLSIIYLVLDSCVKLLCT